MAKTAPQIRAENISKFGYVPLIFLFVKENVRSEKRTRIPELAADIIEQGLQTRLMVSKRADDSYRVLKGHRRFAAIQWIEERNPAAFAELFKWGVACEIREGLTLDEEEILIADHGNEIPLETRYELVRSAQKFFLRGKTEEFVATVLAGLIDRINPPSGEAKQKIAEFNTSIATATDPAVKYAAEHALRQYVLQYRRGFVQNLKWAALCPEIVQAAIYRQDEGVNPDAFKDESLPRRITNGEIKKLYNALQEDLKEIDPNTRLPVYSRVNPGPMFYREWEALIAAKEAEEQKAQSGESRVQPLSRKTMLDQVRQGIFSSLLARLVLTKAAGDKINEELLRELDILAYFAELIREHDKDFYKTFTATAKEIAEIKEREQAAQAKNGKITAEPVSTT